MIDKAHPAGWVIQVTIPGQPSSTQTGAGRLSSVLGAPSFKYFNVAIGAAAKAVEATTKHLADPEVRETSAVRALSLAEIAALGLTAGDVKPA